MDDGRTGNGVRCGVGSEAPTRTWSAAPDLAVQDISDAVLFHQHAHPCQLRGGHGAAWRSRRVHRQRFKAIFREFNVVCAKLGLFGAELVAIDGAFFKAVNAPRHNFTEGKLERMLKEIDQKSEAYLKALETADAEAATQSMESGKAKAERLREKLAKLEDRRKECAALLDAVQNSESGQVSLIDPDARMDRTVAGRADAEFAVVVLHPGPPRRVNMRRRQPDIRRLLDDVSRHQLDEELPAALVALELGISHPLVHLRVTVLRGVSGLIRHEILAHARGRRPGR